MSKRDGGLGFRDFKSFNSALVAKNWWRLYTNPDSLVGKIFKAVYFPEKDICGATRGHMPSYAIMLGPVFMG